MRLAAVTLVVVVALNAVPARAQLGRGATAFTPTPGAKDLKSVLYNWTWHMGMLRSGNESELVKTLEQFLRAHDVTEVTVVGIATDHCVAATALDAQRAGFHTSVDTRYCAGVAPDTTADAVERMRAAGIDVR